MPPDDCKPISVFAATKRVSRFGRGLIPKLSAVLSGHLFNSEGDKESQFGDLARHRLNIYAENTILNQIQLSPKVGIAVPFERFVDFEEFFRSCLVIYCIKRIRCLLRGTVLSVTFPTGYWLDQAAAARGSVCVAHPSERRRSRPLDPVSSASDIARTSSSVSLSSNHSLASSNASA